MNKSTKIKRHVNKEIKEGDRVRLIDGSGLKLIGSDKDVYIVYPYPELTGQGEPLRELTATVLVTEIEGVYAKYEKHLNIVFSPDIIVDIGGAHFFTCSDFVKKESEFEKSQTELAPEIGKWYLTDYEGWIIRVDSIDAESVYGDYIDEHGNYHTNTKEMGVVDTFDLQRPLDPSEIEDVLRTEWERRCKKAGWYNGDEGEVLSARYNETHNIRRSGFTERGYVYHSDIDMLNYNGINIYHKGKFATPKKKDQPTRFFDWDVISHGDQIKIGCHYFTKAYLKGVKRSLEMVSEYSVKEVLDELKKLDL